MIPRSTPKAISCALALLLAASGGCAKRPSGPVGAGTVLSARSEHAGEAVTLRVESVEPDATDPDGDVFLYQVSVRDAAGAWQGYCEPDHEGKTLAIALQGSWDAASNHVAGEAITFACTNGALAKCVRWGYKPWKTVSGVSLADHHQACVHVVRADYCGDGRAHTRDGVTIDVYDRLGIQKRETQPGMVLEAAWSPRGAAYVNKPRLGGALPELVAECPDRLRGRTPEGAVALEEAAILDRWPEVLIFTESHVTPKAP